MTGLWERTRERIAAQRRARRVARHYDRCTVRVAGTAPGAAVKVVSVEDYATGALAAEASPEWPTEMLRALAIACRGFGLHRVVHPRHRDYDVVAAALDQYYVPARLAPDAIRDATGATAGHYLLAARRPGRQPQPAPSLFHSSCGGATDNPDAVWGSGAPAQPVATCDACRAHAPAWMLAVSHEELSRAVGLPPDSTVTALPIAARTPAGRVRTLGISSTRGPAQVDAEQLRARLGHERLRSALFEPSLASDGVRFEGRGDGHGVGLCRFGARAMAADGATHAEILAHYYPGWVLHTPSGR